DSEGLGNILIELLADKTKMSELRATALAYGQETTWPKVAMKYSNLFKSAVEHSRLNLKNNHSEITLGKLPVFSLQHIKRLTNQVGIIQHATYALPNYKEGYCLDDNARALLLVLMTHQQLKDQESLDLISTYLSYIHCAQREDGKSHNFMGFDNRFIEEIGS